METMDFSGTSDISQNIDSTQSEIVIEEKKLGESQMMEFTSSIEDLMEPAQPESVYTNVTSGKITGLAPGEPKKEAPKNKNPFGLNDDQYTASIAGIVAALSTSAIIQSRVATMVPNPQGINGSIATALVAAIIFYFVMKYLKK